MTENRLADVLLRHRATLGPDVPEVVIQEIAAIETANQYDDDRGKVQKELRMIIDQTAAATSDGDEKA